MRTRKKKGKKAAAITLNEDDILNAVRIHLETEGYDLGGRCCFIINMGRKTSTGRQKRAGVEISWDLNGL
jgi:hypothetical protein